MKKKHEIYLFGYHIKEYLPILFVFSIVWAMCEIGNTIGEDNHCARIAFYYLAFSFAFYFYSNQQDKESKKFEIAELNKEITKLERFAECDKQTIDFYKKELEKLQDNSQQKQQ